MRFGRRSPGWISGKRFFGDNGARHTENGGVASEERSALLGAPDFEDDAVESTAPTDDEAEFGLDDLPEPPPAQPPGGDPTQRLLTILGRFQRELNRAPDADDPEEWVDGCMEQLIEGIEVAMGQRWEDVHRALTDTARVLQSYEDAGEPAQSRTFLEDSYEILCLMVGDLIVDNVRSGVMQKWEQRYQMAVEDLAEAGIPVVDDEGQPQPTAPAPVAAAPEADEGAPEAAEEAGEQRRDPVGAAWEQAFATAGHHAHHAAASSAFEPEADDDTDDTPPAPRRAIDWDALMENEPPEGDAATEAEGGDDDFYLRGGAAPAEAVADTPEVADLPGLPEAPADELDAGAEPAGLEELELPEAEEAPAVDSALEASASAAAVPAGPAWDEGLVADETETETEAEVEEVAVPGEAPPVAVEAADAEGLAHEDEDEDDEEDDLFSAAARAIAEEFNAPDGDTAGETPLADESLDGAVSAFIADATEAPATPEYEPEPAPEVAADAMEAAAEPAAPEPEPAPAPEPAAAVPEPGTPQAFLHAASQAMASGDIAAARLAALDLAVSMGQAEVEAAQAQVEAAERDVEANSAARTQAEAGVQAAQEKLKEAEWLLGERRAERETTHGELSEVDTRITAKREAIGDLDRRIQELVAERDAERAALDALEQERTDGQHTLEVKDAAVAKTESETEQAQAVLEAARAEVASLEQARQACEATVADARAQREKHQQALDEMLRTKEAIAPRPASGAEADAPAKE